MNLILSSNIKLMIIIDIHSEFVLQLIIESMDGIHDGECCTTGDFPQRTTMYFEKCKKQRPFSMFCIINKFRHSYLLLHLKIKKKSNFVGKNLGQERLERIRLNYNKKLKLHGNISSALHY